MVCWVVGKHAQTRDGFSVPGTSRLRRLIADCRRETLGGRLQERDCRRATAGERLQERDCRRETAGERLQERDCRRETAGERLQVSGTSPWLGRIDHFILERGWSFDHLTME
jgi:hypothetical protein